MRLSTEESFQSKPSLYVGVSLDLPEHLMDLLILRLNPATANGQLLLLGNVIFYFLFFLPESFLFSVSLLEGNEIFYSLCGIFTVLKCLQHLYIYVKQFKTWGRT